MSKKALFIGRWQPFHNGHKHIIDRALGFGKSVAVGVRDTPVTDSDPFTVAEREEMILSVYRGQDVEVFRVPDIESVNIGRGVGYEVVEYSVPEAIEGISATSVREMIASGEKRWRELVPEHAQYVVAQKFDEIAPYNKGRVVWLTGLPAVGKTTIAKQLCKRHGYVVLDADEMRPTLWPELGYSDDDRRENVRRFARLAANLSSAGHEVAVAVIAPFEVAREEAREIIGDAAFHLVYLHAEMESLVARDPKGMYAEAIDGKRPGFTGIDGTYEVPSSYWIDVETDGNDSSEAIADLIADG